jgi:hypothetical protein
MSECLLFNAHSEQLNQLYHYIADLTAHWALDNKHSLICSHIDIADLTAHYGP